jgi:hypothetical protein
MTESGPGRTAGDARMGFRSARLCAVLFCLLASCTAKEAMRPPFPVSDPVAVRPPSPELEVVQCRLAPEGEFVGVRLRVIGVEKFDPEAVETYLLDETTGEKFSIVRLQRIGRLAEFTVPGEKDVHNIFFRNREGALKVGERVTLVVGSARVEHLQLQE